MAAPALLPSRQRSPARLAQTALTTVLLLSACTTTPLLRDAGDPATWPAQALSTTTDWQKVGDAAFADLVAYLKVDTINPPGNEKNGAQFLAGVLAARGVDAELIDLPSEYGENRAGLIARVKATRPSGEGALCLVSHIDVVTAEADRWPAERGPLSGAVVKEDGEGGDVVYGRGALDMKGMGIMELHALFALIDSGLPRSRDVVVLAVADEEVKSRGMTQMISDEVWGKIGCSHAINEGGLGLKDAIVDGQTVFAISVGERGVLWSRVVAEGPPGHGSTPIPGRAPERLLAAMKRLDAWKDTPTVHPALYGLLAEVGADVGGVNGYVLQRPFLVDLFVKDRLQQKPATKAITNDTINLTGFGGAEQPNVVPSTVWAQYDVRLLPGTTAAAMTAEIEGVLAGLEGVHLEVLETKEPGVSEWDDPVFRALQRNAVVGLDHAVAGPIISPGFTDSILLRQRGVRCYGLIPVVVSAAETASMHGDAERVSKANIARGTKVLALALADIVSPRVTN